ncbi:MAG: PQQ-binding-like beta-propeller repeat protein [Bryobacterales bacterium]|nr:PQQ-binding-like beta-propeller repeat protein [Bryobacterales bacterium]
MRLATFFPAAILILSTLDASDWTQFRGPNASGVLESTGLPTAFGGDTNLLWRTPLPPGHSSPVLTADRIYLTASEGDKLLTFALDRATGRILWRREAPRPRKQEIERPANGPVSASPVTDGTNTYVFFQDFGLLSYGPDGNERWRMALGPFNNPFGHGASPVLIGNLLIMVCDQDTNAFVAAVDKDSGRVMWRTERPHAQRGYATPVPYKARDGSQQVIVTGSYRMSGYDVKTGKELWWIRKLSWQVKPTPVVADHVVYFVTYSAESDPGQQEEVPPFADALAKLDANKDGKLSKDEIVDPRVKARFDEYLDLDNSGYLEERDWRQFQERRQGESALRAYKLGGKGDLTESGLLWKQSKSLPNVPSPLVYRGVLYTLKEGGIFTSYDPKTGEILKQGRLPGALGNYFASPVAADGKIYLASEEGKITVLEAGAQWGILRINEMDGACTATPPIVEGNLYVRTRNSLSRFGKK